MHGGGNEFMDHGIVHNGLFAEYKVLDNFQELCGPRKDKDKDL